MRGKQLQFVNYYRQTRITPAGAGKTLRTTIICSGVKDHPRRCGENPNDEPVPLHTAGSPPQVRGKQAAESCQAAMLRITPAGAGKTEYGDDILVGFEDHPRRCGENPNREFADSLLAGSPPQVRGKRIIEQMYGCTAEDHPRRCGENIVNKTGREIGKGSPPQVRGKQLLEIDNGYAGRITPAGAGKTDRKAPGKSYTKDHPRRCGENNA